MIFSPEKGDLVCFSCGKIKHISRNKNYVKHEFVQNQSTNEKNAALEGTERSMKCPNCGAKVILSDYHISSVCPYCSTDLIIDSEHIGAIKPDAVIPFKFGKEQAQNMFKAKIKKNFFAPRNFKKTLSPNSVQAYYFPAFIFDAEGRSIYKGRLYRENTYTDSKGKHHTSRSYFYIDGSYGSVHTNVEVEASTKLTQQELQWVNPYDYSYAVEYNNNYIFGFSLECNSRSVVECQKNAEMLMKEDIKRAILSQYNYDGISYLDVNTMFLNQKYSYCVLPMYRINYTYKNKKYSNVMNGQTGSLGGKTPKSGIKIAATIILPILIILAFILLINFL